MNDQKPIARGVWYEKAFDLITDPRFVFMNHGYASAEPETFDWLLPADERQRFAARLVRQMVQGVDLDGKGIVDIGCGRGGSCSYFMRYSKPLKVSGIDRSEGNIRFCRRTHKYGNLAFNVGDAESLPFDSDQVDVVFNLESSHLYPNAPRFLKEVFRILRPGGTFCYADMFNPIKVPLWNKLLDRVGFVTCASEDITQNVANAILLDQEGQRKFFDEIIDREPGSAELLDPLHNGLTNIVLRKYATRKWQYQIWRLQKPESN